MESPADRQAVDAFLRKVAATPARGPGRRGRLIFALDATASREPTWDRASHTQAEMFAATADLGGLDVQLVFYRGFGECRSSKWVSDARALMQTMLKVRCLGGHTQIGRVMAHALKESDKGKVDALIVVSDALEEDIDDLCDKAGRLGLKGVPVFLFQEGRDPVVTRAYQQVARLSGGAWAPFDSASAETLKALLGAVARYAAGGARALADYSRDHASEPVRLLTRQLPGAT